MPLFLFLIEIKFDLTLKTSNFLFTLCFKTRITWLNIVHCHRGNNLVSYVSTISLMAPTDFTCHFILMIGWQEFNKKRFLSKVKPYALITWFQFLSDINEMMSTYHVNLQSPVPNQICSFSAVWMKFSNSRLPKQWKFHFYLLWIVSFSW